MGKVGKVENNTHLIENNNGKQVAYNSILLNPEGLSLFGSKLPLRIIKELSKNPSCAMDLSRKLEEHEQKIYYHLRRLEKAGIITLLRTERRYGMLAKIYGTVAPIISLKLYEDSHALLNNNGPLRDPRVVKFLEPFVKDGRLNGLVIVGDGYSHGRFDKGAREGAHTFDFALFLGNFLNEMRFPHYKLDTEMNNKDLKENLILIGHPQTNIIIDKVNEHLPIYFDEKDDWNIKSRLTKTTYSDPRHGMIVKIQNPFNKRKSILVLGGRTRGTRACIIAFTKYIKNLSSAFLPGKDFVKVVKGFDSQGDRIIDDVKFVE